MGCPRSPPSRRRGASRGGSFVLIVGGHRSASLRRMEPLNLDEFENVARDTLPAMTYDFIAGGAEDERSVAANRAAFQRRGLRNRALVDVATRDLRTRLLGLDLPHPILLAPTALHRVAHPDGERATARGASAAGAVEPVSHGAS